MLSSLSLPLSVQMNSNFNIDYKPAGSIDLSQLTYVIIGTRENGEWIFVRHKDRSTWELPAGHIEEGESAEEAAKRELFEETGVTKAKLVAINDYSVTENKNTRSGRIFFASVLNRGPLPISEIKEIRISKKSPSPATYPEAHDSFLKVFEHYISQLP